MTFITVIRITNELPKLKRNEMKNNWPYYKQIKTEKYLKKKYIQKFGSRGVHC